MKREVICFQPQEAVVSGCAIFAASLSGNVGSLSVREIAPFTLSMFGSHEKFYQLFAKNSPIPKKCLIELKNVKEKQNRAKVQICEIGRPRKNMFVGSFSVKLFPVEKSGSGHRNVGYKCVVQLILQ